MLMFIGRENTACSPRSNKLSGLWTESQAKMHMGEAHLSKLLALKGRLAKDFEYAA